MPATIYLITGGARSGKSSFAQSLCEKLSCSPIYCATSASAGEYADESFKDRIKRHQAARDEKWTTEEETMELSKHLKEWEVRAATIFLSSTCLIIY
jgi:adenosylcobinamide kinase/adenosylcobinamide-phosphate guanylyltransferase